ncbi:substrate-binding domain-containing protein [Chroococcidiopsidales cyanobacterium LEGE 13417]|nr:substrate-binding domain-containing protein [Chroococcidiopsidales cyanobacterium LEGE 13417]
METKLGQVCRKCSYDANSATATHCEICHHPLKQNTVVPNKLIERIRVQSSILWLGLALLLLLPIGRGLLVLLNWQLPDRSSVAQTNISRSPNIKLYNTMREVPNVPEGLFNYSRTPLFATVASQGLNETIAQAHPKFRLRFTEPIDNSAPGSGSVIAMLIGDYVSFGQTARPIEDAEYDKAKNRNLRLEQIPIGFDGIAFYTHRDLAIAGLSIGQLQDIFMAKVTNWKQVGGPNLPIVPIARDPQTTGSLKYLFASIKGAKIGSNVQLVRDYTEQVRKVASTPGAISYASMQAVASQRSIRPIGLARENSNQYVQPININRQVNVEVIRDGSYPLTRRLFIVIRRDGLLDEQAGVAYTNLLLSREGQRSIEKAGFVPIRL